MKREVGFTAKHNTSVSAPAPVQVERPQIEVLAEEIGKLVIEKNESYGSAFAATGPFLRLLFPKGIHVTRYEDALLIARIFDKLMRIANRPTAFGESPYRDITGYGLIGTLKDLKFEKGPAEKCPAPGERIYI